MSRIVVLVAATPPDLEAEGIAAAVAGYADMALAEPGILAFSDVDARLAGIPASTPCALILVGPVASTGELARRWLAARSGLVVLRVDIIDHLLQISRISLRDKSLELDSLLAALRNLVANAGAPSTERSARFKLHAAPASSGPRPGTMLPAAAWIHAVLRGAVAGWPGSDGEIPGLTVSAAALAAELDASATHEPQPAVTAAATFLAAALHAADPRQDRLAGIAHALRLTSQELQILLLALAPEFDIRYQRCIGLLLDDMGRRAGTLGLYASLLGPPLAVRGALGAAGGLARWRLLEGRPGILPASDEACRADPALAAWLFGETAALEMDPLVRRVGRGAPWPGARLCDSPAGAARARHFAADLAAVRPDSEPVCHTLFGGDCPGDWCALLEHGASINGTPLVRVDGARLAGLDAADVEEAGLRLARLARLSFRPLLIDACGAPQLDEEPLRLLLGAIGAAGQRCGIVCPDTARIVRLLGTVEVELAQRPVSDTATRLGHVRAAALHLGLGAIDGALESLAGQFPLQAPGFEHAMRLAATGALPGERGPRTLERFIGACQDVAAEGVSRLAESIEPAFELDDVVLPSDRALQLGEIVDTVRLASKVLDGWNFGAQLPYGRGVTVLFHGPSGTGKTMAAVGLARRLRVRILRIDLSRVVSKYIGETEKNIDRVFADAQRSGAAILIDEAEALLGKRSEVKDAHDRYANIEVAYLLQRMETYEGLAILTTNLRQNLDQAFLRRLRFVIDFPRPDADARERIWRRCLPDGSHALDATMLRHLARKVDMTGGHIRQITLRAAYLAAAAGTLIGMPHVLHATRAELAKLGMAAIELELPGERQAA